MRYKSAAELGGGADFGPPAAMLTLTFSPWAEAAHLGTLCGVGAALSKPSDVRLYAILARESSEAVLFRRGPSKRVQLLRWNTATDTIAEGQWLKGRVYERRCDLSPDGSLLLYFAGNYRRPYYTWTAVSRPPYFTALALWPKGDAWGGGGLFQASDQILLNHRSTESQLAADFGIPKWLRVEPLGDHSGKGEDEPIWRQRLTRDGWTLVSEGPARERSLNDDVWVTFDPPRTWEKSTSVSGSPLVLRQEIRGLKKREGPWYLIDHRVFDVQQREVVAIEGSDWADWLPSGDLAFTKEGCLYRIPRGTRQGELVLPPKLVADLADRSFVGRKAPRNYVTWPKRP